MAGLWRDFGNYGREFVLKNRCIWKQIRFKAPVNPAGVFAAAERLDLDMQLMYMPDEVLPTQNLHQSFRKRLVKIEHRQGIAARAPRAPYASLAILTPCSAIKLPT